MRAVRVRVRIRVSVRVGLCHARVEGYVMATVRVRVSVTT